jgi:hypothetical protein
MQIYNLIYFNLFCVLGMENMPPCMLSKCCATELFPSLIICIDVMLNDRVKYLSFSLEF